MKVKATVRTPGLGGVGGAAGAELEPAPSVVSSPPSWGKAITEH